MVAIRILVADDHSIVRRGVRALLESRPGWSVCGEAETGAEAVYKAKWLKPDVIVMDISMPVMNGLEATRQLHKEMPETPVLILSMHESDQIMREVLLAGARGYVLKSDLDINLLVAIPALHRGKTFFGGKVSQFHLDGILKNVVESPQKPRRPSPRLTLRQKQVVRLLAEGKMNKEIAAALNISMKTVQIHRAHIMQKLALRSPGGLVRYALRNKIVGI